MGEPRQTDGLQKSPWRGMRGEQAGIRESSRQEMGIYMAQKPHWAPLVSGSSACWMA